MSDRPNALEVLAHHWPKPLASCLCGWAELGKSHSGHQVEMLRAAVGATEGQPVVILGDGTLTVASNALFYVMDELQSLQRQLRNEADGYAETAENVDKIRVLRSRANGVELAVTLIQRGDPLWRIPGAES